MKTITVKTGLGYFRDAQGHIITKAQLPPGDHQLRDGFTYIEVSNQEWLDAIKVWIDPADSQRMENETKIAARIRAVAIADLKESGDLPADYK